ncbi:MAG TPA: hypothetical protein VF092_19650 [Longimicrobium sp.]
MQRTIDTPQVQPVPVSRKSVGWRVLAVAALVLGLLMVYGGGGHLLAVIGAKVRQGKPYDFRFAALVTNGVILLGSGLTHLVASHGIARGQGWALRASALAAALVSAYCLILLPVRTARGAALPALVLNLAFLVWLVAATWRAARGRKHADHVG